ncbi:MAG: hypothetical protein GWM98_18870, partial [Nitrospinaceae bacterium]|nr:hypothetical protein [Nitrospinaceae bacterium]NIR56166.1 hypothetical protein [Nitrospinaceae bacterium]NIS86622.1 hypothetical protein [Nitrospinaceae bacterium]NIT83455.1 hypothetical protein [Nitrospinaceae bacterium]NIU45660.1 hypothetical protein [Nitrospinaceae bacterium]
TLEIRSLDFDGKWSQIQDLPSKENWKRLSGEIHMKNMDWQEPLPGLRDVSGSLKIRNGPTELHLTRLHFAGHTIKDVRGTVQHLFQDPVADITVENRVDMGLFHQSLLDVVEDGSIRRELKEYRDLKGHALVRIDLKGPLKDPEQLDLRSTIRLEEVSLYEKGFKPRLQNLNGIIHYHKRSKTEQEKAEGPFTLLTYKMASARFGKSSLQDLTGAVTLVQG